MDMDQEPQKIIHSDLNGNLVNTFKQADTFATYLSQRHWAPPPQEYTGSHTPITEATDVNLNPVTIKELQHIIQILKNKAPGEDDITAETWKWLTPENLEHLLTVFNNILTAETIPTDWKLAIVAEIYKGKGNHSDPEMYRPISLLSTAYNIFARVLQKRLGKP
jgi:hypothetical protein